MKHLNIKISGQVQRVGFRYSTLAEAEKLNITGFAQNLADGSVYIEAEGEDQNLERFVIWCKKGPPFSNVTDVKVEEGKLKGFSDFTVR